MKKELRYILYNLIGFAALLELSKPLKEYLIAQEVTELKAQLIAGITIRLTIISLSLWVIWKLKLRRFNNFNKKTKIKNLQSLLIPSLFISIGLVINWNTYINTELDILFMFFSSVMIVGVVEELIFRGTILPLFINYLKSRKNVLFLSVIISSTIFGFIHYLNILNEPDNFWGITHQVFLAISIGVFLGGLMLRTKSILIPSIVHGFIDFSFGTGKLKQNEYEIITEEINWSSIIQTILLFSFILLLGVYMTRKVEKEEILNTKT